MTSILIVEGGCNNTNNGKQRSGGEIGQVDKVACKARIVYIHFRFRVVSKQMGFDFSRDGCCGNRGVTMIWTKAYRVHSKIRSLVARNQMMLRDLFLKLKNAGINENFRNSSVFGK